MSERRSPRVEWGEVRGVCVCKGVSLSLSLVPSNVSSAEVQGTFVRVGGPQFHIGGLV